MVAMKVVLSVDYSVDCSDSNLADLKVSRSVGSMDDSKVDRSASR